jgi:hypothetical protein
MLRQLLIDQNINVYELDTQLSIVALFIDRRLFQVLSQLFPQLLSPPAYDVDI